ncbi:MAG: DUF1778 domain-containing protein [Candidatus Methylumidiphilus sp.]
MHIALDLDDDTGQQLQSLAEHLGENRNTLIREALREWVERHSAPGKPAEIAQFAAKPSLDAFENPRRIELSERDSLRVLDLLEHPPAPNQRLLVAAQALPVEP